MPSSLSSLSLRINHPDHNQPLNIHAVPFVLKIEMVDYVSAGGVSCSRHPTMPQPYPSFPGVAQEMQMQHQEHPRYLNKRAYLPDWYIQLDWEGRGGERE
jgi:hypothetical protein